jgi:hypothetical protein
MLFNNGYDPSRVLYWDSEYAPKEHVKPGGATELEGEGIKRFQDLMISFEVFGLLNP